MSKTIMIIIFPGYIHLKGFGARIPWFNYSPLSYIPHKIEITHKWLNWHIKPWLFPGWIKAPTTVIHPIWTLLERWLSAYILHCFCSLIKKQNIHPDLWYKSRNGFEEKPFIASNRSLVWINRFIPFNYIINSDNIDTTKWSYFQSG